MKLTRALAVLLTGLLLAGTLQAGTFIQVTVEGQVDFNNETTGQLGTVQKGDPVSVSFVLNSDLFLDSAFYPIRAYSIKRDSFVIDFPTYSMPMLAPLPAGMTAYFCVVDNHPLGDGFFLSTSVNSPMGVPLQHSGLGGNFISNLTLTYDNTQLSSLDVVSTQGTYDISGLAASTFTITDGGVDVVGLDFDTMTIDLAVPWLDLGGGTIGVNGQPTLEGYGPLSENSTTTIKLTNAAPNAPMVVWLTVNPMPFAALGGMVWAYPPLAQLQRVSDGTGSLVQAFPWPAGIQGGIPLTLQFLVQDFSSVDGITLSNGVRMVTL